jgi:hypothetical protein
MLPPVHTRAHTHMKKRTHKQNAHTHKTETHTAQVPGHSAKGCTGLCNPLEYLTDAEFRVSPLASPLPSRLCGSEQEVSNVVA